MNKKKTSALVPLIFGEMKAQGVTAKNLAEVIGVHYNTMYAKLKDPTKLTVEQLLVIARRLSIDGETMCRAAFCRK